ncbi:MAG: exosortase H-associated membrane protein [Wenzhouxiangellaceae bacterium]
MSDQGPSQRTGEQAEHSADRQGNPVREMFLLAALYLPLGFFLWFSFGSALMWFPAKLAEWALTGLYPDMFERVVQLGYQLEIQTSIRMERMVEGRIALLNNDVNPMVYAWGMALLFGLIMATPMSARRRALQLLVAYLAISLVTAWGIFWQTWTDLAFKIGPEPAAAVAASGLSPTLIALCYQLGYLMLPAVVPLAIWILMNRPFLEKVAFGYRR